MKLIRLAFCLACLAFGACQPPIDTTVGSDAFSLVKPVKSEEEPLPVCVEWTGIVDEIPLGARPAGRYAEIVDRCFFNYLRQSNVFQTFGLPSDPAVAASPLPRLQLRARLKQLDAHPGFWAGLMGKASVTFEVMRRGSIRPFGFYIASFATAEGEPSASFAYSHAAQAALDAFAHDLDMDRPKYEALKP